MLTHECEVLIVGLGPVGSVAALFLARQGIDVAAIEAHPGLSTDLRASTFHAPTVEMLDRLGATDTLLGQGLKAPVYQYRDRQTHETFKFDLGELEAITRFPFRIQCEQHRVTAEIVQQLHTHATAKISQKTRALFVDQDDDGVDVYVENEVAVERYRAKYVIAADGAGSVVRKLLELDFPGFTYDEKFLCLSTEFPLEEAIEGLSLVNYISDPDEWMVLLRVPQLWRVLVPAGENATDADLLSDATKDGVFARMLKSDVHIETRHRTIYRVHQRVTSTFVKGRVALVGDAAHLNSPMGGFGMNSGIHDAVNVAEKLVDVLRRGGDADALLALFDRQRRTVTKNFIQAQTIENTRMMRNGLDHARGERRRMFEKLQHDTEARRAYLMKQSMFQSLADAAAID